MHQRVCREPIAREKAPRQKTTKNPLGDHLEYTARSLNILILIILQRLNIERKNDSSVLIEERLSVALNVLKMLSLVLKIVTSIVLLLIVASSQELSESDIALDGSSSFSSSSSSLLNSSPVSYMEIHLGASSFSLESTDVTCKITEIGAHTTCSFHFGTPGYDFKPYSLPP